MSSDYPHFPNTLEVPGRGANRAVVAAISLVLLGTVGALWLYLYLKAQEKPYIEVRGYRAASIQTFQNFLRRDDHRARFASFSDFLRSHGVDDAVETHTLLRQGATWLEVDEPAYALPPQKYWPNMVATLKLLRDQVVPAVGPVEILSGYRTDNYNRKHNESASAQHRDFCGLDLVPKSNIGRKELVEELRSLHARLAPESDLGLGIYDDVLFHMDSCGYRIW